MRTRLFTLAMAAGLSLGAMTALNLEAAGQRSEFPRRGILVERAVARLGLTDEQAAQIRAEFAAEKDNIVSLLGRLREARRSLRETIQDTSAEESAIREAAANVALVEADAAVLRARLFRKVSAKLTPAQVERLKEAQAGAGKLIEHLIDRVGERLGAE